MPDLSGTLTKENNMGVGSRIEARLGRARVEREMDMVKARAERPSVGASPKVHVSDFRVNAGTVKMPSNSGRLWSGAGRVLGSIPLATMKLNSGALAARDRVATGIASFFGIQESTARGLVTSGASAFMALGAILATGEAGAGAVGGLPFVAGYQCGPTDEEVQNMERAEREMEKTMSLPKAVQHTTDFLRATIFSKGKKETIKNPFKISEALSKAASELEWLFFDRSIHGPLTPAQERVIKMIATELRTISSVILFMGSTYTPRYIKIWGPALPQRVRASLYDLFQGVFLTNKSLSELR